MRVSNRASAPARLQGTEVNEVASSSLADTTAAHSTPMLQNPFQLPPPAPVAIINALVSMRPHLECCLAVGPRLGLQSKVGPGIGVHQGALGGQPGVGAVAGQEGAAHLQQAKGDCTSNRWLV